MQTLVIGDIHGCYDGFQALLDKAGLTEDDSIVSLGDCVDRGPNTLAVLRFFQENAHALLIMGNHDRKHVRADRHEVKLARSQKISRIQFGETYPDALAFMSELPLYLDLPDALVVHGYFEPGLPLVECSISNFSKSQVCLGNGFSGWIFSCFQLISGENPTKVATMKHSKIESVIY